MLQRAVSAVGGTSLDIGNPDDTQRYNLDANSNHAYTVTQKPTYVISVSMGSNIAICDVFVWTNDKGYGCTVGQNNVTVFTETTGDTTKNRVECTSSTVTVYNTRAQTVYNKTFIYY